MIPWLTGRLAFPPVERALREPNGLLAAGGDLSVARLLEAYRRGIFPWYSEGDPILWWSPDPRMVLVPEAFRITRSLAKSMRNRGYIVRSDTAFSDVMRACAEPRDEHGGTWITDDMIAAYCALHDAGWAHSIETWHDGLLVGGLYGVAIGRMFFGESMFARRTDASKVALAHLVRYLGDRGFGMIDCQMATSHLASLGAREIPRAAFVARVAELVNSRLDPGPWQLNPACEAAR